MDNIDVSKCPACHNYNVFGGIDKPCCYLYHKYCDEVSDCNFKNTYKQLQTVEAENEELRNIQLGFCQGEKLFNLYEYSKCLDEIEKIAKNGVKDDCGMPLDELSIILQLIKQVKEN